MVTIITAIGVGAACAVPLLKLSIITWNALHNAMPNEDELTALF